MLIVNKKRIAVMLSGMILSSMIACQDNYKSDSGSIKSPADTSAKASSTENTPVTNIKPEEPPKAKAKKGKATVAMSTTTTTKAKAVKDKYGIYKNPDVMPSYPGGNDALTQYMEDNIDYSQQAIDQNVTGVETVSFVVDEKGNVSDAKVITTKLGGGLDEAAVKAVNDMPKWTPGEVKGKKVKTRMEMPISFQIQ